MEEEKFKINKEEIKAETIETAKQFKNNIKNTNIKEQAKETKGLIKDMLKNPIDKMKNILLDVSGRYVKNTIFLLIFWLIIIFIGGTYRTIYNWGLTRVFDNILDIIKLLVAPILGILVYSLIVFVMNKRRKNNLMNYITLFTVVNLPIVISDIILLFNIFNYELKTLTNPISILCMTLKSVLVFIAVKEIFEINDKQAIKKFTILQIIYYVFYIIISLFGIKI